LLVKRGVENTTGQMFVDWSNIGQILVKCVGEAYGHSREFNKKIMKTIEQVQDKTR
jgi:hypothetical protein